MRRQYEIRAALLRSTFIATRYRCWPAAVAALGLAVAPTCVHAQAPFLGTTANFSILAGAGVTNTGSSVISGTAAHPGDIGSTTATIGGFATTIPAGPGIVIPPGVIHAINDGPTSTAQGSLTTAYNTLANMPSQVNLTGQDLGGLTLGPGVYNFTSSAQLTGTLTLNGQGNPNAIFIFQIGSTLTTASAASILAINGAQGGNVFWQVGSSATLGTGTSFTGDILALTSITLTTGANITCGAAWASTGAVTLDTNNITLCDTLAVPAAAVLPAAASANQRVVASAIDAFVTNGGTLPLAFVSLLGFLSPDQLAAAFTQLSGEAGTGAAPAGTQAMTAFLALVTNPFADNRGFAPERPPPSRPIYKAPVHKAAIEADPRRWSIWAAGYGGRGKAAGDASAGSHDRSESAFGYATGLDYRVTPTTVAGFALAGGATNYGLSDGLGGGRSDMFQAAVYAITRVDAAYVSAALAYAWHRVSTDRYVTVLGTTHLTADFSANNVGGRIEGGYRFAVPHVLGWGQHGLTPYAAVQVQSFRTPSYNETAVAGSADFALSYAASTTTTTRTELGARFDWTIPLDHDTTVALRSRAAWAHDRWSDPSLTATFQSLPGSSFTVFGAPPVHDSLLASAGAEVSFSNGLSLAASFDGEFAQHSQRYGGTGRLRYTW